jgi:hypothetical protein
MACRIQNLTGRDLIVDLRGGEMFVAARATSPPLREELLYDNVHLPELIRSGAVRVLRARMAEVLKFEGAPPVAEEEPPKAAEPAAAPADRAASDEKADEKKKPAGKTAARKKS